MVRYCFILLLVAPACRQDNLGGLTPPTQTGANTFSCLVDGRLFKPYGKRCVNYGGGCQQSLEVYYDAKRGQLNISAVLFLDGRDELISLRGDSIFSPGEVKVVWPTTHPAVGLRYTEQDKALSWGTTTGMRLRLTRLDTSAHILGHG